MTPNHKQDVLIVGGGAAGVFAAIHIAERSPKTRITLLEKSSDLLGKVRISGGGRCNLTHACFDPALLVRFYPRGAKALLPAFMRFQPRDTMAWFTKQGVSLCTEADGRVFPESNRSESVIECFKSLLERYEVKVHCCEGLQKLFPPSQAQPYWCVHSERHSFEASKVLISTGSSRAVWQALAGLGHHIIEPVASLFTFNIDDSRLGDLAGISVEGVSMRIKDSSLSTEGSLLITHSGLSGPAVLKLSAFGARVLHEAKYQAHLIVNWLGEAYQVDAVTKLLRQYAHTQARKQTSLHSPFAAIPTRLWAALCLHSGLGVSHRWGDLSNKQSHVLALSLCHSELKMVGKNTFKNEFVTAGGVSTKDVDFKTMQSKVSKGLFMAGEVLDIDAVTGGFNFQAAWTTAFIAAEGITEGLDRERATSG